MAEGGYNLRSKVITERVQENPEWQKPLVADEQGNLRQEIGDKGIDVLHIYDNPPSTGSTATLSDVSSEDTTIGDQLGPYNKGNQGAYANQDGNTQTSFSPETQTLHSPIGKIQTPSPNMGDNQGRQRTTRKEFDTSTPVDSSTLADLDPMSRVMENARLVRQLEENILRSETDLKQHKRERPSLFRSIKPDREMGMFPDTNQFKFSPDLGGLPKINRNPFEHPDTSLLVQRSAGGIDTTGRFDPMELEEKFERQMAITHDMHKRIRQQDIEHINLQVKLQKNAEKQSHSKAKLITLQERAIGQDKHAQDQLKVQEEVIERQRQQNAALIRLLKKEQNKVTPKPTLKRQKAFGPQIINPAQYNAGLQSLVPPKSVPKGYTNSYCTQQDSTLTGQHDSQQSHMAQTRPPPNYDLLQGQSGNMVQPVVTQPQAIPAFQYPMPNLPVLSQPVAVPEYNAQVRQDMGNRNNNGGNGGNFNWRPDKFTGEPSGPTPAIWISRFESHARFNNWSEQRMANAMALLITGTAEWWYTQLQDTIKSNYGLLKASFLQHFNTLVPTWTREEQLHNLLQGERQSVDQYTAEFKGKLASLQKSPSEMMHAYVRGLKPKIKSFVIQGSPTTLAEAEMRARLGETAAAVESPNTNDTSTCHIHVNESTDTKSTGNSQTKAAQNRFEKLLLNNSKAIASVQNSLTHLKKRDDTFTGRSNSDNQSQGFQQRSPRYNNNKPHYRKQMFNKKAVNSQLLCYRCHRPGHRSFQCYAKTVVQNGNSQQTQGVQNRNSQNRGYNQSPQRWQNNNRDTGNSNMSNNGNTGYRNQNNKPTTYQDAGYQRNQQLNNRSEN